jgi:hypothetical protein
MTNLQGGITSSQLTPQAFKNSNQNTGFQETFNSQNSDVTTNTSLLYVAPSAGALKVDTGSDSEVLGVSTASSTQIQPITEPGSNYASVAIIVLLISAAMTTYFFRKFSNFANTVDVLDNSVSEE